jgi:hypothetical protein
MKLFEEFKLYENMWESKETSAVVFVGNERNEDSLLSKVAKIKPAYTTTVFSVHDFIREYENSNKEFVKFYTDAEGKAELEKVCANMPERIGKPILNATILAESVETAGLPSDGYRVVLADYDKVGITRDKQSLTEARSVADIEAEIARLQQELAQAKEDEKRAASKGTKSVWIWDMYIDDADKGSWTSIDQGVVFETEDKAIEEGSYHLGELDDEGELLDDDENPVDADEYTVDAIEIPLARVPEDILRDSGLGYLWDPATAYEKAGKCPSCSNMLRYDTSELAAGFQCPYCSTKLKGKAK